MADNVGMAAHLAGQALKFGWYYGVNRLVDREVGRLGARQPYTPGRPVPSRRELMTALLDLFRADAEGVRSGLYPALEGPTDLPRHLGRLRAMLADLPVAARRRMERDWTSARDAPLAAGVPEYFAQDFHYQSGGYLTDDSARLYDVQVETLFYGSADAMRRQALRPIAGYMRGRDQRQVRLLDVACGTGRFLRQARLTWPAMQLAGLDLSRPYLAEVRRHMDDLRPAGLISANAEAMPVADASQDIVVSIFLFHELPGEVRRRVAAEMARVLKPGGLLVFIDSLQMGDRPGWDGLLEAFPVRFHEPYYRHYATDELDELFDAAGLVAEAGWLAFLSKVLVRRKQ